MLNDYLMFQETVAMYNERLQKAADERRFHHLTEQSGLLARGGALLKAMGRKLQPQPQARHNTPAYRTK